MPTLTVKQILSMRTPFVYRTKYLWAKAGLAFILTLLPQITCVFYIFLCPQLFPDIISLTIFIGLGFMTAVFFYGITIPMLYLPEINLFDYVLVAWLSIIYMHLANLQVVYIAEIAIGIIITLRGTVSLTKFFPDFFLIRKVNPTDQP